MTKLTAEDKENIIKEYNEGMLQKDLAVKYHVGPSSIQYILRDTNKREKGKLTKKQKLDIIEEYHCGASQIELYKKYNISAGHMSYILKNIIKRENGCFIKEQKLNIIEEYNSGMLQKDLAKKYNVSKGCIQSVLKDTPKREKGKFTDKQKLNIIEEYNSGISQSELVKKYNSSPSNINYLLKNIEKRDLGKLSAEQKLNIIKEYNSGMSQTELARKYDVKKGSIANSLKNIHKRDRGKFTKEQRISIANEWDGGITSTILAKKYNINPTTVVDITRAQNIKVSRRPKIKYEVNETFFEEIITEKQAYWLGFLVADGNINNTAFRLCLSSKDKEHLDRMQTDIESNYPIKITNYKNEMANLSICRKSMVLDLEKLYITTRKTGNEKFPFDILSDLYRHFIRGYFDGDGCLHLRKKKQSIIFSITCANFNFLNDIQKIIIEHTGISKTKIGSIENYHILSYGGTINGTKICKYLWQDANVYLPRKIIPIINSGLLKEPIQLGTYLDY